MRPRLTNHPFQPKPPITKVLVTQGVRHALKSRTLRLKSVFKTQIKFSNHKSVLKTQTSFQITNTQNTNSSQIRQIRFSNHKAAYKSLKTPNTVQLNLNFTHKCREPACACIFITCSFMKYRK